MRTHLGEQGVTLLELMVSLALAAMIVAAVLALWGQSQQAYMEGAEAADTQQRVRIAMDRLVRAIQAAGANPTNQPFAGPTNNDPAFVAFREAGPSCLRLYTDIDGDTFVTGPQENLAFGWAGAGAPLTIESGGGPDTGQPWVSASTGVQDLALGIVPNPSGDPMFRFFTGPNDATPNTELVVAAAVPCGNSMPPANRSRIGRIVITLTAQGQIGSQTFTRTLVSEARPRNVP
jgi:prepilin-type N-terminal cleavage/methylation domain-containing protein